ncbi:MAG: HAD-IIA family hydrolase [Firmicutes bacterium]|nr:HAD-IIA family hydrolase [Bacillota bacterium]MCM1401489.1 HAD-IIA family hydrolase [Bacteroides sp.]MCM1477424.1 HAD-IIA family hydrolase [Bacteroides sp.]
MTTPTCNTYLSPMSADELRQACRKIKHVALDMDGTIYMGSHLFPFTQDFLAMLRENGIGYSFLTNNPTRSIADYLAKLEKMGIEASTDNMYTTAVATIDYLKANMPDVKRLFVVGTPSMKAEFERAGFELTKPSADDMPQALVVAFDTTLEYERLCHASWLAAQGVPYIATNPDRVCPTNLPTVLVDCGSLCACIEHATSRKPDIVIGKPNPDMLSGIRFRHGLQADEIAMCGDRIYTDVAMARNAGALGVLVLSGETTLDTALNSDPQPPITAKNILEFGKLLVESKK